MALEQTHSDYIQTSKKIIKLTQEYELKKLRYKLCKLKLRDDVNYAHIKSKTAKDEQILIDTMKEKEDLITLSTKIHYLQLKQALISLQLQGIIDHEIIFDDVCNVVIQDDN